MKRRKRFLLTMLMAIVMMAVCPQMMWAEGTKPSSGSGTISAPYQITSADELIWFRGAATSSSNNNKLYATLTADIDLSGKAWTPIGTYEKPFYGTFNGDSHSITGLTITGYTTGYQGLFGYVKSATIQNFTLSGTMTSATSLSTSKTENCFGTVVGYASNSTIKEVTSSVDITLTATQRCLGGIVGVMDGSNVLGCTYSGTIDAYDSKEYIGGIAGNGSGNSNTIKYCHFAGELKTTSTQEVSMGGILGSVSSLPSSGGYYGSLTYCFSSGTLSASTTSRSRIGAIIGVKYSVVANSTYLMIKDKVSNNTYLNGDDKAFGTNDGPDTYNQKISISVSSNNNDYGIVSTRYVNPTSNSQTLLQIKATPNTGYHFNSWSDSGAQTHTKGLTSNVSLIAIFHPLTATAATAATCSKGNTAYWTCSTCNKLFSDEACTQETTLEDVTFATIIGEHDWYDDTHTYCARCKHSWLNYKATEKVSPKKEVALSGYADANNTFNSTTKEGVIEFTSKLMSIDSYAFSDCYNLLSITIPSSVTSIGNEAFSGCYNLQSITIPSSVTSIGNEAFSGCYVTDNNLNNQSDLDLTVIRLSGLTIVDTERDDGLLLNKKAVVFCRRWAESVTLPEGVTSIDSYAFSDCHNLQTITFPEGVGSIGVYAFNGCTNLESVEFKSIPYVMSDAFKNCDKINNVTLALSEDSYVYTGNKRNDFPTLTSFSYPRTVTGGNIVSFVLPVSVPVSSINGKVWKFSTYENDTFKFEDIKSGSTEAGVPYLVELNNGATQLLADNITNFTVDATATTELTGFDGKAKHIGTYTKKSVKSDGTTSYYGFSQATKKFVKAKTGTLNPFRTMFSISDFVTTTFADWENSNSGENNTINSLNDECQYFFTVEAGDTLSFDYDISTDADDYCNYAGLRIYIGNEGISENKGLLYTQSADVINFGGICRGTYTKVFNKDEATTYRLVFEYFHTDGWLMKGNEDRATITNIKLTKNSSSTPSEAKAFVALQLGMDNDEETQIIRVDADAITGTGSPMYNLQGQRISKPVKGQVYIQNGKKVLSK